MSAGDPASWASLLIAARGLVSDTAKAVPVLFTIGATSGLFWWLYPWPRESPNWAAVRAGTLAAFSLCGLFTVGLIATSVFFAARTGLAAKKTAKEIDDRVAKAISELTSRQLELLVPFILGTALAGDGPREVEYFDMDSHTVMELQRTGILIQTTRGWHYRTLHPKVREVLVEKWRGMKRREVIADLSNLPDQYKRLIRSGGVPEDYRGI